MSVNINVPHNGLNLDLDAVLHSLADKGYGLAVSGMTETDVMFYIDGQSTRPISICREDNGTYEVRITSLATIEDYQLFVHTVDRVISELHSFGKYEDDDDDSFKNAYERLDDEWIARQSESDFRVVVAMSYHDNKAPGKGSEVGLYGPVNMFYVGKRLLTEMRITTDTPYSVGYPKLIERLRRSQYCHPYNIRITSTNLHLKEPDGEDKSVTVYARDSYDLITKADYIAIAAGDEDFILIDYEDFIDIAPVQWERFDNSQFFTCQLADAEWQRFIDLARVHHKKAR